MRCFSVFCLLRDKLNTIATLGQAVDHIRAREAIGIKQTRTCTHMHIPAPVEYTVRILAKTYTKNGHIEPICTTFIL